MICTQTVPAAVPRASTGPSWLQPMKRDETPSRNYIAHPC
nr:MAG TPA_asm: hypothetical protein [Caudoviricetes sp.]